MMCWPSPRFRLQTLIVLVACSALGTWAWVEWISPTHRWRRMIRSDNESAHRWDAAEKAMKGLVPGVDRGTIVAEMLDSLSNPSPRVRQTAVATLGRLRGPEARPVVAPLVALLKDPDTEVRGSALGSLAQIAETDPETLPTIEPILVSSLADRSPDFRIAVGYRLTLMGRGEPAIPALEAALRDGHDQWSQAAYALGLPGSTDPRAVEVLEMAARHSSDPRTLRALAKAHKRILRKSISGEN